MSCISFRFLLFQLEFEGPVGDWDWRNWLINLSGWHFLKGGQRKECWQWSTWNFPSRCCNLSKLAILQVKSNVTTSCECLSPVVRLWDFRHWLPDLHFVQLKIFWMFYPWHRWYSFQRLWLLTIFNIKIFICTARRVCLFCVSFSERWLLLCLGLTDWFL